MDGQRRPGREPGSAGDGGGAGVDRALVGDMVGHSSVEQTLDYETVAPEERQKAIDAVMVQFVAGGQTGHDAGHAGIGGEAADPPTRYDGGENEA